MSNSNICIALGPGAKDPVKNITNLCFSAIITGKRYLVANTRNPPTVRAKKSRAVAQGSAQEWQSAADSGGVEWQVCAEAGKAEGRAADAARVFEFAQVAHSVRSMPEPQFGE